ncbi:hypothetical protein G3M48_002042 [Beauveria asiatica]|uniref:BPL/LPL catalytic domain-containing protein n=1 Tax=Beauveria asiatica TaxID=1069075 RepID=A0AAW0RXU5_9HYPO
MAASYMMNDSVNIGLTSSYAIVNDPTEEVINAMNFDSQVLEMEFRDGQNVFDFAESIGNAMASAGLAPHPAAHDLPRPRAARLLADPGHALPLHARIFGVASYARLLETTTQTLLADLFSIETYTNPDEPGVWVGAAAEKREERKIATLGVHHRRYVTVLGVALNMHLPVAGQDEAVNPIYYYKYQH